MEDFSNQINQLKSQFTSFENRLSDLETAIWQKRNVTSISDAQPLLSPWLEDDQTAGKTLKERVVNHIDSLKTELNRLESSLSSLEQRIVSTTSPSQSATVRIPENALSGTTKPAQTKLSERRIQQTETTPQRMMATEGQLYVRHRQSEPKHHHVTVSSQFSPQRAENTQPSTQTFDNVNVSSQARPDSPLITKTVTPANNGRHLRSLVNQSLPKYRSLLSRAAKTITPTKHLEGDSRTQHKESHVQRLQSSDHDSFALRNQRLAELNRLSAPAKKAIAFEQNRNNRPFLKCVLNPSEYYKNAYFNKTVTVPVSDINGQLSYEKINLDEVINQQINNAITSGEKLTREQALSKAVQQIAKTSAPYQNYLNDKEQRQQRDAIKTELIINKQQHREDIEKARHKKTKELLENAGVMAGIKEKYSDIYNTMPSEGSVVDHLLRQFEQRRKALKKEKNSLKSRIKAFFIEGMVTLRPSSVTQIKKNVSDLKTAKVEKEEALVDVKKYIAKISQLSSELDQVDQSANSLIKDLNYSLIRQNKQKI